MKKFSLLASTAILTLSASSVFAAVPSTTAITTVDISPWLQDLLGVAALSVPVFLGAIGTWAKAHFNMAAGSNAANIVDLLVTAGKQYAVGAIAKAPTTLSPLDVKNAAIAAFLSEISDSTQAAMKLKGVTPESVAMRINGEVTTLLAQSVVVAPIAPKTPTETPINPQPSVPNQSSTTAS